MSLCCQCIADGLCARLSRDGVVEREVGGGGEGWQGEDQMMSGKERRISSPVSEYFKRRVSAVCKKMGRNQAWQPWRCIAESSRDCRLGPNPDGLGRTLFGTLCPFHSAVSSHHCRHKGNWKAGRKRGRRAHCWVWSDEGLVVNTSSSVSPWTSERLVREQ